MHKLFGLFLLISLISACNNSQPTTEMETNNEIKFDWQGHRGARGLVPENTIPAFLKALEYQVTTLELDVAISKDKQIVISHEPWMSHHITTKPDSTPVLIEEAQQLNLHQMMYDEIKQYDVGLRGNERFPEQVKMDVFKPTFSALVKAVDAYCEEKGRTKPYYNIEIKSHPTGDSLYHPIPSEFANIVLKEVKRLGLENRVCIQSFDPRSMMAIHQQAPEIVTAFLVENKEGIFKNLAKLDYQPQIYSPDYTLLSKSSIDSLHEKGMKVIPWTINEVPKMDSLIEMGVDGIITDYPNLIEEVGKKEG